MVHEFMAKGPNVHRTGNRFAGHCAEMKLAAESMTPKSGSPRVIVAKTEQGTANATKVSSARQRGFNQPSSQRE